MQIHRQRRRGLHAEQVGARGHEPLCALAEKEEALLVPRMQAMLAAVSEEARWTG